MSKGQVIGIIAGALVLGAVVGKLSNPRPPAEPCTSPGSSGSECDQSNQTHRAPVEAVPSPRKPSHPRPPQESPKTPQAPRAGMPQQAPQVAKPQPGEKRQVSVAPDDAALGPAGAQVTIVEFSDFQCPYCGKAAATLKRVRDAYGDKVRVVFKHHPLSFHKDAPLAHQAAVEAHRQGRFWEFHDRLFETRAVQRTDLEGHAQALGLDMTRFTQALDSGQHATRVQRDVQQAQSLGATGTPAFFINGRFLSGAQPLEKFKEMIDAELRG